MFLDFVLDLRDGVVEGSEAGDGNSVFVDDELGEVPLDEVAQESSLLGLEENEEGMGVAPVHVDLAELQCFASNKFSP